MIDHHYNFHIFGNTAFTLFLYSKYSLPNFFLDIVLPQLLES